MLGVAKKVTEEKIIDQLNGQLKFIFQPAEERASGAELIIKAGALENPSVDRILGAHMNSDMPVGQVGFFKSVSHASADTFRLTIKGKGVHGAYPHSGVDPIAAGAYFVNAVQTIVSRNINPTDSAVVTVGQFQAGTAPNIIPEQALLTGTVRAFKDDVREKIILRLTEISESLEKAFRVEVDYEYIDGVPIVINNETVTAELFETAVKILGEKNVFYMEPQMGGEDFGLYTQRVPGTFMRIGCRNPEKGIIHKGHSPYFDVDEASLAIGVEIFTEAVRSYLKPEGR
jgi:amidohydrolase